MATSSCGSDKIILHSMTITLYSTGKPLAYLALRVATSKPAGDGVPHRLSLGTKLMISNSELNRLWCTRALIVRETDLVFGSGKFT
jgi:hypothetical protein